MGKGLHEHSKIIDDLGGTGFVAEMLGSSAGTVSDWRDTGIPRLPRMVLAMKFRHLPREWLPVKPRKRRAKK